MVAVIDDIYNVLGIIAIVVIIIIIINEMKAHRYTGMDWFLRQSIIDYLIQSHNNNQNNDIYYLLGYRYATGMILVLLHVLQCHIIFAATLFEYEQNISHLEGEKTETQKS